MNNKREFSVEDAYALETPADNLLLYAEWAGSYDEDFVESQSYVCHLRVAEVLLQHAGIVDGAVLDVGCGTGVVGVALSDGGIATIDGIDISPAMLEQSRNKKNKSGKPVYRNLIEADLTRRIALDDDCYAALVSSGTFTHGHLGPESLDELWRVAAPGAWCAIGINSRHYDLMGFGQKFAEDTANGTIADAEFAEVDMYSPEARESKDNPHAADTALIAVCRVL